MELRLMSWDSPRDSYRVLRKKLGWPQRQPQKGSQCEQTLIAPHWLECHLSLTTPHTLSNEASAQGVLEWPQKQLCEHQQELGGLQGKQGGPKKKLCFIFITKYFPHYSSDDCNRFIKVKVLRKLALICFCKGKSDKIAFQLFQLKQAIINENEVGFLHCTLYL